MSSAYIYLLSLFLVFANAFFVVSEFSIVKIRHTKSEEPAHGPVGEIMDEHEESTIGDKVEDGNCLYEVTGVDNMRITRVKDRGK